MKRTFILSSCLAFIVLFSAWDGPAKTDEASAVTATSETTKNDMSQVRAEISAVEKEWADALNKKDINALMALYADDAASMQDGAPTLTGKAAIQAQQEKDFTATDRYTSISFETKDVFGNPDEVTEVGTSSMKDATGKAIGTGKYMAVYQKKDGKYKCIREIYNKDSK